MNKKLHYFIEYLSLSTHKPFEELVAFFHQNHLLTPLAFEQKLLRINAAKEGIKIEKNSDKILKNLDEMLSECVDEEIHSAKKRLFETLIQSNFKKNKEEFDKVETSIYRCLSAYVFTLCRTLEVFYCLKVQAEPEVFINFGKKMHITIIGSIFNEEEKKAIQEQLDILLSVFLTMYSKYMYK